MPDCSYPALSAAMDLKAMHQIDAYIKEHSDCTYQDVASHIAWYWEQDNASMWMSVYIENKL